MDRRRKKRLQEEGRGYHNWALLLPDGKVLIGGGLPLNRRREQARSWEQATTRVLTPPYLTGGVASQRPVIQSVSPVTVPYGETLSVHASSGIDEFVLMGLGSITHSVDTSARNVKLSFSGTGPYTVTIPAQGQRSLPPGPYMLFALKKQQMTVGGNARDIYVPSIARFITITL